MKTIGQVMQRAAERLGPAMFCDRCYGWTNAWHVCTFPHATPFRPTTATLRGGLTEHHEDHPPTSPSRRLDPRGDP